MSAGPAKGTDLKTWQQRMEEQLARTAPHSGNKESAMLDEITDLRAELARRDGPGTPSARFDWLLSELRKRFPSADDKFAAAPPEPRLLAALDEALARPAVVSEGQAAAEALVARTQAISKAGFELCTALASLPEPIGRNTDDFIRRDDAMALVVEWREKMNAAPKVDFCVALSRPAAPAPEALRRIAEKMRKAGASIPAPENKGTAESAIATGLSIGLLLVQEEIESAGAVPGASTATIEQAAKICEGFCAVDDKEMEESVNFILRQRAQRIRGITTKSAPEAPTAAQAPDDRQAMSHAEMLAVVDPWPCAVSSDQIQQIVDRDTPPDNRNEVVDHDLTGKPIARGDVERFSKAAPVAEAPTEQTTIAVPKRYLDCDFDELEKQEVAAASESNDPLWREKLEHAALVAAPATEQAKARRSATDQEVREWAERHDIENRLGNQARAAFEDAESLHMTFDGAAQASPAKPDLSGLTRWKASRRALGAMNKDSDGAYFRVAEVEALLAAITKEQL